VYIVKERKRKFLQKFILNRKSLDLFDQFVGMREREIYIDRVCSVSNVFVCFSFKSLNYLFV